RQPRQPRHKLKRPPNAEAASPKPRRKPPKSRLPNNMKPVEMEQRTLSPPQLPNPARRLMRAEMPLKQEMPRSRENLPHLVKLSKIERLPITDRTGSSEMPAKPGTRGN